MVRILATRPLLTPPLVLRRPLLLNPSYCFAPPPLQDADGTVALSDLVAVFQEFASKIFHLKPGKDGLSHGPSGRGTISGRRGLAPQKDALEKAPEKKSETEAEACLLFGLANGAAVTGTWAAGASGGSTEAAEAATAAVAEAAVDLETAREAAAAKAAEAAAAKAAVLALAVEAAKAEARFEVEEHAAREAEKAVKLGFSIF